MDGELSLAQTTLGWLFRKISNDFSIDAAREYLRRGLNEQQGSGLRAALKENYDPKFELFFPIIEPDQLEMIDFLNRGANGSVLSAIWNRPANAMENSAKIRVAMKHPREELNRKDAQERFLDEVRRIYRRC